jgi:hypothetical protein
MQRRKKETTIDKWLLPWVLEWRKTVGQSKLDLGKNDSIIAKDLGNIILVFDAYATKMNDEWVKECKKKWGK